MEFLKETYYNKYRLGKIKKYSKAGLKCRFGIHKKKEKDYGL